QDVSTDVLSFPLLTGDEVAALRQGQPPLGHPPGEPVPLGDVVLNLPESRRAALRYGHSHRREVGFLLVHGFLHLLGFDHPNEPAERQMMEWTERILARRGLVREGG